MIECGGGVAQEVIMTIGKIFFYIRSVSLTSKDHCYEQFCQYNPRYTAYGPI